jgi:hypothetical protein
MIRDLLLEALNKRLFLDLTLLILTYGLSWLVVLKLGFRILKADVRLKTILPGALLGALISISKPFLPEIVNFFITMIPLVFFLKFYGKTKLIISCWVTFLLLLATSIGPLLIINPLSNSNQIMAFFFYSTRYGIIVAVLIETLIPAILLMLFFVFNVSLIPSPGRILSTVDFVDVYLFGALLFWCYNSFMRIWKNIGNIPRQIFLGLEIECFVAAGALVALYIRKVNTQKRLENAQLQYQELTETHQRLREDKLDPQELDNFLDKLLKIKDLNLNTEQNLRNLPILKSRPEFTRRERVIIRLIAKGYDNPKIARELHLSGNYITNVISDIRGKLSEQMDEGISDRMLVIYAIYWSEINKQ